MVNEPTAAEEQQAPVDGDQPTTNPESTDSEMETPMGDTDSTDENSGESLEDSEPTASESQEAGEAPKYQLVNKNDGNVYDVVSVVDQGDHTDVNTPGFGVRFEKVEDQLTSDSWILKPLD